MSVRISKDKYNEKLNDIKESLKNNYLILEKFITDREKTMKESYDKSEVIALKESFKNCYDLILEMDNKKIEDYYINNMFESTINLAYLESSESNKEEIQKMVYEIIKKSRKKREYMYKLKIFESPLSALYIDTKNIKYKVIGGSIFGALLGGLIGPFTMLLWSIRGGLHGYLVGFNWAMLKGYYRSIKTAIFDDRRIYSQLLNNNGFKNNAWQMIGSITKTKEDKLSSVREYLEALYKDIIGDDYSFNFIEITMEDFPELNGLFFAVFLDSKDNIDKNESPKSKVKLTKNIIKKDILNKIKEKTKEE